ncbi:MAG: NAD(P)-dependent oxidoreductase [Gemmataceae bacterium]|nr:NAD(P)-dependent oxidoreductase [Gemmataceae bacterium]
MEPLRTVLITGASGNLGRKLRDHLQGRFPLRLLDRDARGDPDVVVGDLARWSAGWADLFTGVDTVVHFAADPEAYRSWHELVGPNVDALINVYQAAIEGGARRFVFASSNHVMGGYQDEPGVRLTPELPPRPGLRYVVDGQPRNSAAYGAAKLFGERLGKCCAEARGLEVIAVRIGWVWRGGANVPANLPRERGAWFRLMWLSDRDFCHLMERCLLAELPGRFVIVNGMSANYGMAWDLESTRRILGYQPQDDVTR